jgi:hypothetical protein
MISPTQTLPDGYRQTAEINLAKSKGLAILLNVVAVILFILVLLLLGSFLGWARPEPAASASSARVGLLDVLIFLASIFLVLLLHELIHGLFFWIFTRSRPVFALRPLYAYAAAPDWFIPARQYWIVGLAPLVCIGAAGLLLLLATPAVWIPMLAFLVALNTAGCTGDLFLVAQLLRLSRGGLVRDTGDRVSFFEAGERASLN